VQEIPSLVGDMLMQYRNSFSLFLTIFAVFLAFRKLSLCLGKFFLGFPQEFRIVSIFFIGSIALLYRWIRGVVARTDSEPTLPEAGAEEAIDVH